MWLISFYSRKLLPNLRITLNAYLKKKKLTLTIFEMFF